MPPRCAPISPPCAPRCRHTWPCWRWSKPTPTGTARRWSPHLRSRGADYLGVATIEEGVELRAAGVRKPILVLTGAGRGDVAACHEHQLSVAVLHREMVRELAGARDAAAAPRSTSRSTPAWDASAYCPPSLPALLDDVRRAGRFDIDGIFSHFANADSVDREYEYSDYQLEGVPAGAGDVLAAAGERPRWVHIANSAATLSHPDTHFTMVRPGIVLYGVPPSGGRCAGDGERAPSGDASGDTHPASSRPCRPSSPSATARPS